MQLDKRLMDMCLISFYVPVLLLVLLHLRLCPLVPHFQFLKYIKKV